MKTAIIYISVHHGNTKKVVNEMAELLDADLFDLTKVQQSNNGGGKYDWNI